MPRTQDNDEQQGQQQYARDHQLHHEEEHQHPRGYNRVVLPSPDSLVITPLRSVGSREFIGQQHLQRQKYGQRLQSGQWGRGSHGSMCRVCQWTHELFVSMKDEEHFGAERVKSLAVRLRQSARELHESNVRVEQLSAHCESLEYEVRRKSASLVRVGASLDGLDSKLMRADGIVKRSVRKRDEIARQLHLHLVAVRDGFQLFHTQWSVSFDHATSTQVARVVSRLNVLTPDVVSATLRELAHQTQFLDFLNHRGSLQQHRSMLIQHVFVAWRNEARNNRLRQCVVVTLVRKRIVERNFRIWRLLTKACVNQRLRHHGAVHFRRVAAHHRRVQIFYAWRSYSRHQAIMRATEVIIVRQHARDTIRSHMALWHRAVQSKIHQRNSLASFLNKRRRRATERVWRKWSLAMLHNRNEDLHHQHDELRTRIDSVYSESRRASAHAEQLAVQLREALGSGELMKATLERERHANESWARENDALSRIFVMARIGVLRHVLHRTRASALRDVVQRWRHIAQASSSNVRIEALMAQLHNCRSRTVEAFKDRVRRRIMRTALFQWRHLVAIDSNRRHCVALRCLRLWHVRAAKRREVSRILSRRLDALSKSTMRSALRRWRVNATMRHQCAIAISLFLKTQRSVNLRTAVDRLRRNAHILAVCAIHGAETESQNIVQSRLERDIGSFRRGAILRRSLAIWQRYTHRKVRARTSLDRCMQWHRRSALQCAFHVWQLFVHAADRGEVEQRHGQVKIEALDLRGKLAESKRSAAVRMLSQRIAISQQYSKWRAFHLWERRVLVTECLLDHISGHALRLRHDSKARLVLSTWNQLARRKHRMRVVLVRVAVKWRKGLLQSALSRWRVSVLRNALGALRIREVDLVSSLEQASQQFDETVREHEWELLEMNVQPHKRCNGRIQRLLNQTEEADLVQSELLARVQNAEQQCEMAKGALRREVSAHRDIARQYELLKARKLGDIDVDSIFITQLAE